MIRKLIRRFYPVTHAEAEECFQTAAQALADSMHAEVAVTIRVNTRKRPTLVEVFAQRYRRPVIIGSGTNLKEAAHFAFQKLRDWEAKS